MPITNVKFIAAFTAFTLCAGGAMAGPLPDGVIVDYQLGGAYPPPQGVTGVVRDSTDDPAAGYFNICYVNGFQTQPGVKWPTELLVQGPDGQPLKDPNWPDESLLDLSTRANRARNLAAILPAITACATKGFDAVEFDNLDSYTRSDDRLTLENAVAFATLLVKAAHDLGLTSAQKNLSELGQRGRDQIGFDFAITEECHRWDECNAYTDVYGDQVIGIEYADDLRGSFVDACADPNRPPSLILRDRMLTRPGAAEYVFAFCPVAGPAN